MAPPSKRNPKTESEVLFRVASGEPLATVLRSDPRFPHYTTWYDWLHQDEELAQAFARAREAGEQVIAADCLAIIDQEPARVGEQSESRIDPSDVQNRRLRFEGRLKLLAKWNPKKWGEKLDVTSDGKAIVNRREELDEGARRVGQA
jgi:hypothetical protein